MGIFVEKPAPADFVIDQTLARRWSPVAFSPEPVEPAKLAQIVEAARWAPSARNIQPWRFVVVRRDRVPYAELFDTLSAGNQRWNGNVPVFIVGCLEALVPASFVPEGSDRPANRHAWHDLGLANAYLMLQATALGLHTHLMTAFDADAATDVLGLPQGMAARTVLALGYGSDGRDLDPDVQARDVKPRVRMPLDQMVFGDRYDSPADFLT